NNKMIFTSPVTLFRLYLTQMWVHLSVVWVGSSSEEKRSEQRINRTYLTTFIAFGIAIVYGVIGLHLEGGETLSVNSLRTSVYFFTRQIFIRKIWFQIEIIFFTIELGVAAILLDFALKGRVKMQHQLVIEGKDNRMVKLGGKGDRKSTRLNSS